MAEKKEKKDFRIYLPNKPGQLVKICFALSSKSINIKTISGIAGTPPVLALVTDQQEETRAVLDELGLEYDESDILIANFSNISGEIARFAQWLADAGVNISAIYMLGEKNGKGEIAFTVSDIEVARQVLARLQ